MIQYFPNKEAITEVDILAVGVHPDDIELGCGGTLLQHIAAGYKVGLLDLTQGELGTRGSAPLRLEEAAAACELMGASFRLNLGMRDGFLTNDETHLLEIIRIIRRCRPKIVLANSLNDRHPDHGRAAKLTADACFYSGLAKIQTETLAPHRPQVVYHYIQDYNLEPDFVVDISAQMDKKLDLVLAFGSQFYNPNQPEEAPNTPISGADFIEFVRSKARTYGRPAGFMYAECFNVNRVLGVKDLFDLC
jgi:N-acetylglucosamine malate deacetylase 1